MNRRELLQNGLAVLAAAGVEGEVATMSPVNPQAVVLSTDRHVSDEARKRINEQWKRIFAGTKLADVPVIVLDGGTTLQVIDQVKP